MTKASGKMDAGGKPGHLRPSSSAELGRRISAVLDLYPSRVAAAEIAGKSTDQLLAYARGDTDPPFSVVARLASSKNVRLKWIWTGQGEMMVPRSGALEAREDAAPYAVDVELTDPDGLKRDGYVLIPRVDVQVSAGSGAIAHSEQVVDHLAFKEMWIRDRLGLNPRRLLIVETAGDSMEPTISDGDILLVDTSEQKVTDNAIYAMLFGEALVVKRLQRRRDGSVEIRSDNPKYSPEIVPANEVGDLRVIGRIRWAGGVV